MSTEVSDDFDLSFANGSMKELAMRMGDLDKELDEIAIMSNGNTGNTKKVDDNDDDDDNEKPKEVPSPKHSEMSADDGLVFSDGEDEDDDDDGLDDLTKELQHLDAAAVEEKEERVKNSPKKATSVVAIPESSPAPPFNPTTTTSSITVTIYKPTPTSPVGISMKTTKGKTIIVAFAPGGICANHATLKVGMQIQKINHMPIRSARDTRELIRACRSEVHITCISTATSSSSSEEEETTNAASQE
jgi:hypothetical protein